MELEIGTVLILDTLIHISLYAIVIEPVLANKLYNQTVFV